MSELDTTSTTPTPAETSGAQATLPAPADGQPAPSTRRFGTFGGVFTPTLLTILGVIMYLRLGWVVGNAGVFGTLAIIFISFGITACTALSMSSITTNIRIGAGGAYSIIVQSLGLEVGGSVGIPRFIAQSLAVTMYVFGFREGWRWFFPTHPPLLVDFAVAVVIFGIAYLSANLAIRVQYVIMAVIVASLVAVVVAALHGSMQHPAAQISLWGTYRGSPENGLSGTSFWTVFAVFFPAATGIMAGANMSGELEEPRKSIPVGTIAAIGLSLVIYLLLAYWLARSATLDELVRNYTALADASAWPPAVLAGLLGATFSSALATTVGASRILQAMAAHGIVPASGWVAQRTKKGEPRNALLVTAAITSLALLLRDLNAVAPLITLFFLITYMMINLVLFIEQTLDLPSFRPLMRIPRVIPLVGATGSLVVMFIVSPTFSIIALVVVLSVYMWLVRRHVQAPFEDVRSSLFVAMAEWAAEKVHSLPVAAERAWKPNLLLPVANVRELRGSFQFITDIAEPNGSVKLVGLGRTERSYGFEDELFEFREAFRERGVSASSTVIYAKDATDALLAGMQALRGAFFKPNIVFVQLPDDRAQEDDLRAIITEAQRELLGTLLYAPHPKAGLARQQHINVWIHDRSPDWQLTMEIGNLDLSILIAYKLQTNWRAKLRLVMVVEDPANLDKANAFLNQLEDSARIPGAEVVVATGDFETFVVEAPRADLNIFGMLAAPDFDFMRRMTEQTGASCLFVRDSGVENALA